MKSFKLRFPRILFSQILLGSFVVALFHPAEGRMETIEQAQAEAKLSAVAMEMIRQSEDPSKNDQATLHELKTLKVGTIQWTNINVQSVLSDLTLKSLNVGLQFAADLPLDKNKKDRLGRTLNNNVCLLIGGGATYYDLLMAISEQTNLAFHVKTGGVVFRIWEPGDIFACTYLDDE